MSTHDIPFHELDPQVVDCSPNVICFVDSEMLITRCNPAWDSFALANDGANAVAAKVVGANLISFVPAELREFYSESFERCRKYHAVFGLDYECSSAEVFRLFHLNVYPSKHYGSLALVHSLRVERPHEPEQSAQVPAEAYLSENGIIHLCSHCRRARRQDGSGVWDWVPSFLQTRNRQISHGVCPVCYSYYYPSFYSIAQSS